VTGSYTSTNDYAKNVTYNAGKNNSFTLSENAEDLASSGTGTSSSGSTNTWVISAVTVGCFVGVATVVGVAILVVLIVRKRRAVTNDRASLHQPLVEDSNSSSRELLL